MMPWVALVLEGVFIGLFWVRGLFIRRHVLRGGRVRPSNSWAMIAGVLFLVADVLFVAAPILQLVDIVQPFDALEHPTAHIVGVVIFTGSAVIDLIAQSELGSAWPGGREMPGGDVLVTDGIYRYVRHPIYLGAMGLTSGLFLMVPNIVGLACAVAVVVVCQMRTRLVEEPLLRQRHGRDYSEWARITGRMFPWLGRELGD